MPRNLADERINASAQNGTHAKENDLAKAEGTIE